MTSKVTREILGYEIFHGLNVISRVFLLLRNCHERCKVVTDKIFESCPGVEKKCGTWLSAKFCSLNPKADRGRKFGRQSIKLVGKTTKLEKQG